MSPLAALLTAFQQRYHADPAFIARAPGRVNLLGEHVDYNAGWVLPVAIDRATYVAARACESVLVSLGALDLADSATFRVTEVNARKNVTGHPLPGWALYPAGVAAMLQAQQRAVSGLDAVFTSDVPRGAGLSSSAALEVAFATAWEHTGQWTLKPMEKALLCQRAENDYVGVQCGIMDQFASACGVAGHALLLDCRTLTWETLPLPPEVAIVVADTSVRRELTQSAYNTRRAQCQAAVDTLRQWLPDIEALRDVSVADFNRYAQHLDPVVAQRARHVVEECARTQQAAPLLRAGEVAAFGQLMNECHRSLRDLYEVSCPELNVMANIAQELDGCYGARLTGAGFGGCTVNLVAAPAAADFKRALATRYTQATHKTPEIYICRAANGAEILS